MAISSLGRNLITKSRCNHLPSFFSRSFTVKPCSTPGSVLHSSSASPLLRSLVSVAELSRTSSAITSTVGLRCFSTRQTTSSLNDPSPNFNNRPPKETILLDGCDFEHWLIVLEKPEGDPTRDEIIDYYIKTVAQVVGSEEQARKQIYSVSTKHYYAIGALVSEEVSYKFKELPKVRWVLPDSYLDVRNKDYGGEPFIDGQAVPYDPKYHEEWVRNNARANERSRRNDRPRNSDRSRNFERRRENMQNRDFQAPMGNRGPPPPGPNMGGGPSAPGPNMGGPPAPGQNMGGGPPAPGYNVAGGPPAPGQNMGGGPPAPGYNMGGGPPTPGPNMGSMPPNANFQNATPNVGYMSPNAHMQNSGPNYGGGMVPNANMQNGAPNYGAMPPRDGAPNPGYSHNMNAGNGVPNYGAMPPRDAGPNGGYSNSLPNAGNMQNQDMQYRNAPNNGGMPYQSREVSGPPPNSSYQNSYAPNRNAGGNNAYQIRDLPGRDSNSDF